MVCGGPSLRGFDFNCLKGHRHVAINRAYEVCPEAEAVVFLDRPFWDEYRDGLLEHSGELVRAHGYPVPEAEDKHPRLTLFPCRRGTASTPEACLEWIEAAKLDVERVVLLGCDGEPGPSGESNWHSGYPWRAANQAELSFMVGRLTSRLEVLNANPSSKLTTFPRVTMEEALEGVLA
jgi:hypothetical protein